MGSPTTKFRHPSSLLRHHLRSILLVFTTFILTHLLDRISTGYWCPFAARNHGSPEFIGFGGDDESRFWMDRRDGSGLDMRVYVYDEDEIVGLRGLLYGRDGRTLAESCVKGQWGTQVKIHRMFLGSRFRVRRKEEADLFFVPTYVKCVRMLGGLTDREIDKTFIKVLNQMPYFRRTGGRDHGDRTDKKNTSAFSTWKDIIIPGNVDDQMTSGAPFVQPLPLSRRKHLANYLGRAQGKVGRLQLIELAKKYPEKLECPELKFSGSDKFGRKEYFEHLRNSKFCLAPRGESSWTLRFYESFFVECVPVLLSDQVELPFQDVIDYSQISIKWPSTQIGPLLLDYLESIPDEMIEKMIERGRRVRCLFVYAQESQTCSAINGIFWELQKKIRRFHQSSETFWLHNGSVVNRDLVPFSDWKPPIMRSYAEVGWEQQHLSDCLSNDMLRSVHTIQLPQES
ncbi:putative glucuronoxylan glucuronosyltransferase IRX7 [Drosera capensis]